MWNRNNWRSKSNDETASCYAMNMRLFDYFLNFKLLIMSDISDDIKHWADQIGNNKSSQFGNIINYTEYWT